MKFLTVNGEDVSLERALSWSAVDDPVSFYQMTIERAVIVLYAQRQGISVDADDLKKAVAEFRYDMDLASADETTRWLTENRMDGAALTDACHILALREKLLAQIEDGEILEVFEREQPNLEAVSLYVIRIAGRKDAAQLADRIRSGSENFHLAAMARSIDRVTAPGGGFMGLVGREDLPDGLAVAVFSVDPGDVVGPLKIAGTHDIYLVKERVFPTLEDFRPSIREQILRERLDEMIGDAVVFQTAIQ